MQKTPGKLGIKAAWSNYSPYSFLSVRFAQIRKVRPKANVNVKMKFLVG